MSKYQILNTKYSKKVIVAMVILLVTLSLYKWYSSRTADAAWYGTSGWSFRKKLVIDYTKVSGAQVNFPILVSITDSDLKNVAQSTGNDIFFTSADGTTKLDHEIEKYTSGTGTLVAWVRIPSLSATADTEIYMYYGNRSVVSQQNKTGVWDSSFVGVWHLSETSGNYVDSKNNITSNAIAGLTTRTASGFIPSTNAPEFSGTNNYITFADSDTLDVGGATLTMEAWAMPSSLPAPGSSASGCLFAKAHTGPTIWQAYNLSVYGGSSITQVVPAVRSTTTTNYNATGSVSLSTSNWYYLAGVLPGVGSSVIAYTNGSAGTSWNSGNFTDTIYNGAGPFAIGNAGGTGYGSNFTGIIDEVRLSSSARSAGWITTTYNTINSPSTFFKSISQALRGPASPILYWRFDEASGSSANDSSGYSNTGTLGTGSTAPSWETSIVPYREDPSSLKFDGSNDYVSKVYSNDTELDIGSSAFNVSSWFRHSSTAPAASTTDVLLARYSGAGYKVYMNSSGYMCFGIDADATWTPTDSACSTTSYADSKWHFLSAIKDGVSTITLYIDGVKITQTSVTATGSLSGTSPPFYVGIDSDGTSNPWDGYIDEVKIYDGALTAAQVKADYNAKGSVKGTSASFGSEDPQKNLSQGLVGWWKMDENTGTTTADSSGNNNTGTLGAGNSAPSWSSGKFGPALTYDGSNDYVTLGSAIDFSTKTTWTIAGWFKQDANPSGTQSLVNHSYNNNEFGLAVNSTNIRWETGGPSWTRVIGFVLPTTWTHVTAVFSGTSGNWSVGWYKNGVFSSHATSTATFSSPQIQYIGGPGTGSGASSNMDDVRIYSRALSPAEVTQLYKWAPGPVGWWKMDEKTGTSAYDTSGNNYNSQAFTGNTSWTTGKYGSALSFDGNGDHVTILDNDNLTISTTNYFTVETWVKLNVVNVEQHLVSKRKSGNHEWSLFIASDGKFSAAVNNTASGAYLFSNYSTPLSANTWYHLVFTADTVNNVLYGYLNGVQVFSDITTSGTLAVNGTADLQFGEDGDGNYDVNGTLDNIRVYNYARTPEQIVDDMNARGTASVGGSFGGATGWWKFDEGYGTTAYSSGSIITTLNGTLGAGSSAPSWSNNGKYGKALSFDGSNDYVYTSNAAIIAANTVTYNSISYGGWVNPSTTAASKTIIHKNNEFRLTTDANSKPQCELYSGSWQTAGVGASALSLNSWSHVLCTYDGANIKVYVNGIQSGASVAQTGNITSSSSTALNIGRDPTPSGYFNGLIDEVKIYNFALSPDQVKVEYNWAASTVLGSLSVGTGNTAPNTAASQEYCVPGDSTSCAGPVGEWRMDEGRWTAAAGQIIDTSGNALNGQAYNGLSTGPGKIGRAGQFNGSNDNARIPNNSLLIPTGDMTIELWFKLDILPTSRATGMYVFNKACNTTPWSSYYMIVDRTDYNNIKFYWMASDTSSAQGSTQYVNNNWISINNWYHVAGVRTGNLIYLYVNGVRASFIADVTGKSIFQTTPLTLIIGASNTTPANPFQGAIDQVQLYNYARTPAQITWDYNHGKPVAWYKFDECTGSITHSTNDIYNSALDGAIGIGATAPQTSTGTCNSGTASEAWNNGTNGKYNGSLNFDGQDDKVTITDNAAANTNTADLRFNTSTQDFSLFAWVKRSATGAIHYVISKEDADNDGWRLMINADNTVTCGEDATDVTSTLTISDTNWHHVGCIISRAGNGQMYIDGVANGAAVAMGSDAMSTTSNVTIGTRSYTSTNYFNGQIDDVRIYNYALTATQVKKLYNNDSAVYFGP